MGPDDTEDQILDYIGEQTGENFDVETDAGNQQQVGGASEQGVERNIAGQPVTDPSTKQRDPNRTQTNPAVRDPNAVNKDQPRIVKDNQGNLIDAKGNLVDQNGKVIAAAGVERRLHEQNSRLRAVNANLEKRTRDLESRASGRVGSDVLNGIPAKLGMDQAAVQQLFTVGAKFRSDPAGAARDVIQMALQSGVSLQQIINDAMLPDISLKATQDLISKHLGPIQEERQRNEQTARTQARAQQEADQFYADYPHATVHDQDLQAMVGEIFQQAKARGDNVSPRIAAEMALSKLEAYARQHGLDFSKPIGPQVAARVEAIKQGKVPTNGTRPQIPSRSVPMPRGGGGGGSPMNGTQSRIHPASSSTKDVVAEAMREAGLDLHRLQ